MRMSRRSGRYGDGIVPKMACVMGYIYEGGGNLTSGKAHHPVNQRPPRRSESIQQRCGAGQVVLRVGPREPFKEF